MGFQSVRRAGKVRSQTQFIPKATTTKKVLTGRANMRRQANKLTKSTNERKFIERTIIDNTKININAILTRLDLYSNTTNNIIIHYDSNNKDMSLAFEITKNQKAVLKKKNGDKENKKNKMMEKKNKKSMLGSVNSVTRQDYMKELKENIPQMQAPVLAPVVSIPNGFSRTYVVSGPMYHVTYKQGTA